jgi:hypothetical protein
MDLLVAYQLGEYPPLTGVHFNILGLVGRLRDADGELGRRVKDQEQRLAARRNETVGLVLFVESLLDQAKLERPARPQTYPEYERWAEQVASSALAAAQTSAHETAAYFLGHNLGDLMLTLALRAIVDDWKAVAPTNSVLVLQGESLAAGEARGRKNLELVSMSPALPEATTGLMKEVTSMLAELERADADRGALFAKLEGKRQELARSLAPAAAASKA